MTQTGGAEVVESLIDLEPRPTAIICSNDLMAIGAMNRIQNRGLQVGQDIAIGGFDDIPLSAYVSPPLTTLHQPIYEIGRRVCSMLIGTLNGLAPGELNVLLTPSLVVRASSGSVVNRN
jgi:LacI family transcriptional regulator